MVIYATTTTEQEIETSSVFYSETQILSCAFLVPKLLITIDEKIGLNWASSYAKKIFLFLSISIGNNKNTGWNRHLFVLNIFHKFHTIFHHLYLFYQGWIPFHSCNCN